MGGRAGPLGDPLCTSSALAARFPAVIDVPVEWHLRNVVIKFGTDSCKDLR
jgi:hypothetical protein